MSGYPESPRMTLVERVLATLERVEYRVLTTGEDREQVFRLRYDAYLRENAIVPNAARRMTDPDDDRDNALIVGVYADGELASSMRLHVALNERDYLPSAHVFPEVLGPKLKAGAAIIDPTRFVADTRMSRLFPELPYVTLRVPWMAMAHFNADIMLAAVRQEHAAFYRRLWGNELLAPARAYPGLSKPICLTALDFRTMRNEVERRFVFFRSTDAEHSALFGPELGAAGIVGDRLVRKTGVARRG